MHNILSFAESSCTTLYVASPKGLEGLDATLY